MLPLGQNLGDARVDARINDRNMLMARYSVSSNYESSPNPFPALPATDLHSKAQDYTVRWTKIISPTIQNVAQAALYDSPFIFGAVGPGVNVNGMAGIQGFDDPTVVPGTELADHRDIRATRDSRGRPPTSGRNTCASATSSSRIRLTSCMAGTK